MRDSSSWRRWINRGIDDHDLMMFIELRSGILPVELQNDSRFAAALERLDLLERAATYIDEVDRLK